MEYINLDLEEKVVKCLFFDKDLFILSLRNGGMPDKIFSDKSMRFIYTAICDNFRKQGELPTIEIIKAKINKANTKGKNNIALQEKIYSVVDRIFSQDVVPEIKRNFEVYSSELFSLHQAREIQEYQMRLFEHLDNTDVDSAIEELQTFHLPSVDEDIEQGEYTESFKRRELNVIEKYKNPDKYQLLPIGIPQLDAAMDGGVGREFSLIYGNSNSGKSFLLQHGATVGYRLKKNIILFTIEMQWQETMNRLDSSIAGLDSSFFRNPVNNWTREEHVKWRKKIKFAKKHYGKLQTIAFSKGASMPSIEAKVYETMNIWQEPIHAIYIDYLDDIEPTKQYKTVKEWTSYGEIAWDMHLMSKGFKNFDNTLGVPVISAMQLKKLSKDVSSDSKKENRRLDERDAGSSPLPFRIADNCFGIKTIEDNVYSVLEIMKARGVSKSKRFDILHNYQHGKFHDEKMRKDFMDRLDADDRKELEDLEEMEIENLD